MMSGPREVLMRNEPGFILDKDAALIIPRVSGNSGQCKLTTSAADISSSTSHQRKPGQFGGFLLPSSAAMTRIPIAVAISAARRPIRPKPTIPMVLPCNSTKGVFQKLKSGDRELSRARDLTMERDVMTEFEKERKNQLGYRGGSVGWDVRDNNITLPRRFQIDLIVAGEHRAHITEPVHLHQGLRGQRCSGRQYGLGFARPAHDGILRGPIEHFQVAHASQTIPAEVARIYRVPRRE
jgi:hypothetical protein